MPLGLTPQLYKAPVAAPASRAILPGEVGSILTTRGAVAAVTLTLPAIATVPAGWNIKVYNAVGQNLIVNAAAGTIMTFNNAAASSVAFSTAGQLIGGSFEIISDGTSYLVRPAGSNTVTVA
jgi:hypothetical protein